MMKITCTKNEVSVSTIMPYDQRYKQALYKQALKDSVTVRVEKIYKRSLKDSVTVKVEKMYKRSLKDSVTVKAEKIIK